MATWIISVIIIYPGTRVILIQIIRLWSETYNLFLFFTFPVTMKRRQSDCCTQYFKKKMDSISLNKCWVIVALSIVVLLVGNNTGYLRKVHIRGSRYSSGAPSKRASSSSMFFDIYFTIPGRDAKISIFVVVNVFNLFLQVFTALFMRSFVKCYTLFTLFLKTPFLHQFLIPLWCSGDETEPGWIRQRTLHEWVAKIQKDHRNILQSLRVAHFRFIKRYLVGSSTKIDKYSIVCKPLHDLKQHEAKVYRVYSEYKWYV